MQVRSTSLNYHQDKIHNFESEIEVLTEILESHVGVIEEILSMAKRAAEGDYLEELDDEKIRGFAKSRINMAKNSLEREKSMVLKMQESEARG